MSQSFDWKQVLNTQADPQKAAEEEGLAVNPVTGEPILDKKPEFEVVDGGIPKKVAPEPNLGAGAPHFNLDSASSALDPETAAELGLPAEMAAPKPTPPAPQASLEK